MIGLFVVYSSLETREKLTKRVEPAVEEIKKNHGDIFGIYYFKNKDEAEKQLHDIQEELTGSIILVGSGGTESLISFLTEETKKPVLLWAIAHKNSLAAAMEAYALLKHAYPIKFYYSPLKEEGIEAEVKNFIEVCKTIKYLNAARLGIIGEPSPWLLTSHEIKDFSPFTTTLVHIPISELTTLIEEIDPAGEEDWMFTFMAQFKKTVIDNKDIRQSYRVYKGLKLLVEKYQLTALTIRCFDLLDFKYTACLALALLNDEGIVAGCESDLDAVLTMMIVKSLTDKPSWMANPSRLDWKSNIVTLAHCTVPLSMLDSKMPWTLTTHMESNRSTAVQGPLICREINLLRMGLKIKELSLSTGMIIDTNMRNPRLCRTQADVLLDTKLAQWVENSPGNHQVLVYGGIEQQIAEFCHYSQIKLRS